MSPAHGRLYGVNMRFKLLVVGENKWLLIFYNFLFEWFRFVLIYYKYFFCHLVIYQVKSKELKERKKSESYVAVFSCKLSIKFFGLTKFFYYLNNFNFKQFSPL